MKWTDTQRIAEDLADNHSDIDPKTVRFTQLRELVLALHAEGAFKGKSASNYVANVLNMGRATVYKHLKELKG